jgi:hypothetical protein
LIDRLLGVREIVTLSLTAMNPPIVISAFVGALLSFTVTFTGSEVFNSPFERYEAVTVNTPPLIPLNS